MERFMVAMNSGKPARTVEVTKEEEPIARLFQLMTRKPMLYVANLADATGANTDNPHLERVRALAKVEGAALVPLSCRTEAEIAELESPEDRQAFLADLGLEESGFDRLARLPRRLHPLKLSDTTQQRRLIGTGIHQKYSNISAILPPPTDTALRLRISSPNH